MLRKALVGMVIVALVAAAGPAVSAADFDWEGGTAAWDTDANWSPDAAAADYANAAKEFLATSATGGVLNADSTPTFAAKLTIQGNGDPDAYSGATLRFNEETLVAGNLHLDGGRLYPSQFGGGTYQNGYIGAGTTLTVDSVLDIDMSNVAGGRNVRMDGPIAGSGNLTLKGSQLFWVQSGSNTYNGVWTVNGPILVANATNCLGTGQATIESGMLDARASISGLTGTGITANAGGTLGINGTANVGTVHLNGGVLRDSGGGGNGTGTFYVDVDTTFQPSDVGGRNLTLTGSIIGAAARTISVKDGGNAWLSLNTDNSATYAGDWVVSKYLRAMATNAFGTGTVTVNTGALALQASITSLTGDGITMNPGTGLHVEGNCTASSVHVDGVTIEQVGSAYPTFSGNVYLDGDCTLRGKWNDGGKGLSMNAVLHGAGKMILDNSGGTGRGRIWLDSDNSADFTGGWDVDYGKLELRNAKGLGGGLGPAGIAAGPLYIDDSGLLDLGGSYDLHVFGLTLGGTLVDGLPSGKLYDIEDLLPTWSTYFSGSTANSTIRVYTEPIPEPAGLGLVGLALLGLRRRRS